MQQLQVGMIWVLMKMLLIYYQLIKKSIQLKNLQILRVQFKNQILIVKNLKNTDKYNNLNLKQNQNKKKRNKWNIKLRKTKKNICKISQNWKPELVRNRQNLKDLIRCRNVFCKVKVKAVMINVNVLKQHMFRRNL